LSELSQRLNQLRTMLDDLVEAETLVGSIGELLAQRNALREQVRELGTEIATKRQAVAQEVAALDADLAIRQRAFADEIARMEEQTATAKAEQARVEHELQDVHMRLDHTRAVYSELRKKFA
jgi:chromosome segregation ATPase